jgi:alpha-tubulin suppressor-like RCC1 family protein
LQFGIVDNFHQIVHSNAEPVQPRVMFRSIAIAVFTFASLAACRGTDPTTPNPPAVATVSVTGPSPTLKATRSLTLTATAFDSHGSVVPNITFAWASSNNAVATVDANGVVQGISVGTASITAGSGGHFGTFDVQVTRAPIASISVSIPPGDVVVGKTALAVASVVDSTGKSVTDAVLKWSSTDSSVARVDATGLVTAIGAGTARIEASDEGIKGSAAITVIPVPGLRLKSISAHDVFSCGLSTEGAAFCWGSDWQGSLGSGDPPPLTETCGGLLCTYTPLKVAGDHVFSVMSEGSAGQTCAIASDGAYCWGTGTAGEVGSGNATIKNPVPTKVQSSATYISLSVGAWVTCGVTTSHAIDCWGANVYGELGDSTVTTTACPSLIFNGQPLPCSTTPHRVPSSLSFAKVSVGSSHVCALTQDGTAYCWGLVGALGSVATSPCLNITCNKIPTPVTTDLRFTDITAGSGFTCGISTGSRVYCWGQNTEGQLGIGTPSSGETYPVAVNSSTSFVKVYAGNGDACGIDVSGNAWCWGFNIWGQLGDGSTLNRASPVLVALGAMKFKSLSLGQFHTCGIDTSGTAFCWGNNTKRQLGIGRDDSFVIPKPVAGQ